jgi:hypothetical protein
LKVNKLDAAILFAISFASAIELKLIACVSRRALLTSWVVISIKARVGIRYERELRVLTILASAARCYPKAVN